MKNKRILYSLILVFCLISTFIGYKRYQQVNARPQLRGIKEERFFKRHELVHAPNVNFVVNSTKLVKSKTEVKVKIQLLLQQTGPAYYGIYYGKWTKDTDFSCNMFLNVPYVNNNAPSQILDSSNHSIILKIVRNPHFINTNRKYIVYFTVPRSLYKKREQKLRFSFLVPDKSYYLKYSLLLE